MSGRVLHQMLVVDTFAVAIRGHPHDISHFEVVTAFDDDPRHPVDRRTFVTRDESLFHTAMRVEVQRHRIAVHFHHGPGPTSAHCCWLDSIEEEPC